MSASQSSPFEWSQTPERVFAHPENATQDPPQEEHTSQDSVQQERATQDPITQPEEKPGKRLYYTPELKLKLIRLCISESERYLSASSETEFWQYLTQFFKQSIGYQGGGDVRRKVTSMVIERKGVIEARKKLSGVAEAAATDLDQAIDMWIEIIERRRDQQSIDIEGKAEIKAEKAAAEVLRDNLTKSFGKKRDFQAVVDACETVDLTGGDVVRKRRQIRENLRKSREDDHDDMKENIKKLTDVFIKYMNTSMEARALQLANSSATAPTNPPANPPVTPPTNAPTTPPTNALTTPPTNAPTTPPTNAPTTPPTNALTTPPTNAHTTPPTNPAPNPEMANLEARMDARMARIEALLTAVLNTSGMSGNCREGQE